MTTADLIAACRALAARLADPEGLPADDADAALAELGPNVEAKLLAIAHVRRGLADSREAYADQQAALAAAVRRVDAEDERLAELGLALLEEHLALGGAVPKAPGVTIALRVSEAVLVTAPASDLPDDLVRVSRTPNLTAIKAALAAGRDVPGASVVQRASLVTTVRRVKGVPHG